MATTPLVDADETTAASTVLLAPAPSATGEEKPSGGRAIAVESSVLQVPYEELADIVPLDAGGYGQVFVARHPVYAKIALKYLSVEDDAAFLKEASVLSCVRHPNCVQLLGVTVERLTSGFQRIGMLMEFMEGGDLMQINPLEVSDCDRAGILFDLASGLAGLHYQGYCHHDIKPRNCFLSSMRPPYRPAKIGDFGVSCPEGKPVRGCTKRYASPEVLLQQEAVLRSSDVYSFGLIVLELFTDKPAFLEERDHNLLASPNVDAIKNGNIRTLVVECTCNTPTDRPSMPSVRESLKQRQEEFESDDPEARLLEAIAADDGIAAASAWDARMANLRVRPVFGQYNSYALFHSVRDFGLSRYEMGDSMLHLAARHGARNVVLTLFEATPAPNLKAENDAGELFFECWRKRRS